MRRKHIVLALLILSITTLSVAAQAGDQGSLPDDTAPSTSTSGKNPHTDATLDVIDNGTGLSKNGVSNPPPTGGR